jgi:hypothetical protein
MNIRSRISVVALAALAVLAGCNGDTPRSGALPTPTFSTLEIPNPAGGWMPFLTSSPPPEILPTRGRAVRIWFYAPVGSTFDVSLRALDGTLTMLPDSHGNPMPSEAGFFQVVSVNVAVNPPPLYTMLVRAPLSLADPANYDILVVNKSLRTDVTDSAPMVVALRQKKVFTVTVMVSGNGHVTSNPSGIQCGTTPSGATLTDCSYEFGPGPVSLAPGSNDLNTTKFVGWTGNCPAGVQVCTLALIGMAPVVATATFGPSTGGASVSTCPTAPVLSGLRWVDIPDCASGNIAGHPGISHPALCDAQGYFCCEPGPSASNAPRCGGTMKIESLPDCGLNPNRTLRQPGGCYEVNSFP